MPIENVHFSQEFVFLLLYQRQYDSYQSRIRGTVGKKVFEDFQWGLRHIEFKSVFPFFFFDVQENSVVITAGIERTEAVHISCSILNFQTSMQDNTLLLKCIQLLYYKNQFFKKTLQILNYTVKTRIKEKVD